MADQFVVATLNVTFGEDTATNEGVLKLEIDDREDGMNGGDTSFSPGDDVYYFLYKDDNVTVLEHFVTAGGITAQSSVTREIEDEKITFSNSDSGTLNYPPDGSVDMEWMGKCFTIQNGEVAANSELPNRTRSQLKIPRGKSVAGILRCNYDTTGQLFKLSGVPEDFDEVLIVAIGRISS
jgi:hypothetical protein